MTARGGHHDLVVVANRLPVQRSAGEWQPSPGGLVRAVLPLVRDQRAAWVGWPGTIDDAPDPFTHGDLTVVPVPLDRTEHDHFYERIANEALWPLFHDAIRPPVFDHDAWDTYVAVNERFARAAAAEAAPGAVVWVHDYHLLLVPSLLRAARPDLRIGFFLHIPFPPPELFRRLPWREAVLRGLLGADHIGFQSEASAANFRETMRAVLELPVGRTGFLAGARLVHVDAHPISIDVREVEQIAADPATERAAHALREQLGYPERLLLGVDRLDYTKGIDARIAAFGALLDAGEFDPASTVLVQVAVPTRGGLPHYDEERQRVERAVGEVNGRHGGIGRAVVQYVHRSLSLPELVALYRAADVMLVTPLRDGMNLVAKEYVASRVDGCGALVLSEFAGAAEQLTDALLVNPHDPRSLRRAMVDAVELPFNEARRRMSALRRTVAAQDVHQWAEGFLGRLVRPVAA